MLKDQFNFKLSDELKAVAPHFADTVFLAIKHDTIEDLYTVWWTEDGEWDVNNYTDTVVGLSLAQEDWIIID